MAVYAKTTKQADDIWDQLSKGPQTMREIREATGLTVPQVRRAMRYIKEVFQVERIQPITYNASDHTYELVQEMQAEKDFLRWSYQHALTRLRTLEFNVEAASHKFDARLLRRAKRNHQRLVEDLEDLLVESQR
jgi:hypothetical protein